MIASLIGRVLYDLVPYFVAIALWCMPLIYLRRAIGFPVWLFVYFVLVVVFTVVFSVWWVTP